MNRRLITGTISANLFINVHFGETISHHRAKKHSHVHQGVLVGLEGVSAQVFQVRVRYREPLEVPVEVVRDPLQLIAVAPAKTEGMGVKVCGAGLRVFRFPKPFQSPALDFFGLVRIGGVVAVAVCGFGLLGLHFRDEGCLVVHRVDEAVGRLLHGEVVVDEGGGDEQEGEQIFHSLESSNSALQATCVLGIYSIRNGRKFSLGRRGHYVISKGG